MIFNIFKSKPTLSELIPNGFVDIHSHILPGIDDGSKNVEESLDLISKMQKLGFSKIIGTPHTYQGVHNNTSETIKSSYNKLKSNLNPDVNITYASEYMIDSSLLIKAKSGDLLTLKDKYILVEMSYAGAPKNLHEILFEICLEGFIPVIAHPERYRFFFKNKNKFELLRNIGCKFQINLFSLIGYYGNDVVNNSNFLLENELIDFVGSDIHKINEINNFNEKILVSKIEKIEKSIENTKVLFS